MTVRFTKGAVLESSDGIEFNKETAVESEEQIKTRRAKELASNKPLYQQLAEREERKKEEYDANTKLIFSGPRSTKIIYTVIRSFSKYS